MKEVLREGLAMKDKLSRYPELDIERIYKIMETRPIENGYGRISCKGNFPLHDYDTGLLYIKVYVLDSCVRFYVGNYDDGDYGAMSKRMPKHKAIRLVERIKEKILRDLHTLPDLLTLNRLLSEFGLNVQNEL